MQSSKLWSQGFVWLSSSIVPPSCGQIAAIGNAFGRDEAPWRVLSLFDELRDITKDKKISFVHMPRFGWAGLVNLDTLFVFLR